MASKNYVLIIGRIGKDPDLSYTNSSVPFCTFSVATSEMWKTKEGQKKEKTEWHNIVTWKKTAENCYQYLNKGSLVCIEGRIQTQRWETPE